MFCFGKSMIKVLLFLIVLCMTYEAVATTRLEVVTEEWRPFNYTNDKGELVGRATEKVKVILENAEFLYNIRSYPWIRSMKMASENKNTVIYSIYRTPDREKKYQWICPLIAPVKVYLFKLKSRKDIHLTNLEDAKKYIISVNRSDSAHEYLLSQGFVEGVNLDTTVDPDAGPRKFFAGRVDLLMQSEWEMTESVKRVGQAYELVERSIKVNSVNNLKACMAVSLDTDIAVVQRLQKSLDDYNNKYGLE